MNSEERNELLIRLDEKTDALCRWTLKHEEDHKEQKASIRRWLYPVYTAVIGVVLKLVFWN